MRTPIALLFLLLGPAPFSIAHDGHGHGSAEPQTHEASEFENEVTHLQGLWRQCQSACELQDQEALTRATFEVAEREFLRRYHEPFGSHFLLSQVLPWIRNHVWSRVSPRTLFRTGVEVFGHYGWGAVSTWVINEVLIESGFYAYAFANLDSVTGWLLGLSAAFHLTDIAAVVVGGSLPQWWRWFVRSTTFRSSEHFREAQERARESDPIDWAQLLHLELESAIPFVIRRSAPFTLAPRTFERIAAEEQAEVIPSFSISEIERILKQSRISLAPFRSLKHQPELYAYTLSRLALRSPLFLDELSSRTTARTLSSQNLRTILSESRSDIRPLDRPGPDFIRGDVSELTSELIRDLQLALLELESTSSFFKDRVFGPRLSAIRAFRKALKQINHSSLSILATLPPEERNSVSRQLQLQALHARLRRYWLEVPKLSLTSSCSDAFR